jgi:signal transduction histidine kinase
LILGPPPCSYFVPALAAVSAAALRRRPALFARPAGIALADRPIFLLLRRIRPRLHSPTGSNVRPRAALAALAFAFVLNAPATAFAAESPLRSPSLSAPSPSSPLLVPPAAPVPALPNPRVTGTPFLTTWAADDYGGAPITFHVVQHPQTGFVYVGNTFGVLEFDGAAWRVIRSDGERVVPMVLVDTLGTVWFGGSNEVGILQPDARGELQPVDVTARLPAAERNFGRIYLGTVAPDGVYLAGPTRLLFFGHDGSARSWRPGPTNFNGLCWHDGALHASLGAGGLVRLEQGALVPVAPAPRNPNPAIAATLRLFAVRSAPGAPGALFLTNIGPLRWAGRGQPLEPLSSPPRKEFSRENATTAAFLPDGRLAFSFPRQGLLILESSGAISTLVDRTRGLGDIRIDHLATDNQGGLWLARLNGLARLQLDSPFALHGDFDAPRDLLRHGSRLYVAHYQGAAWRDDATGTFHSIANLPSGLKSLLRIGDRLFGTGQFLYEITPDNRAVVALPLSFNGLIALRSAPGYFAGASVAGLRLLRFDARGWHDVGLVTGVNGNVRAVVEDRDGWLWALGYHGSGSWRVDVRAGARPDAPVEYFDEADTSQHRRQLPTTTMAREIRAILGDSPRDRDATLPSQAAPDRPDAPPFNAPRANADHERTEREFLLTSPPEIWRRPALAPERGSAREVPPIGPLRTFAPKTLLTDYATRTLWLGGQGALVSIDPAWRPAQPTAPLRASVRRLTTAAGELLWADSGSATPPLGSSLSAHRASVALNSSQNSLRFTFAAPAFAPDYRGVIRTVYRTRLAGLEDKWSNWSSTPWREFTALPYRDFVFHVQARDIDDRESTPGTLAFTIAPPWWLGRPAFAGYIALALLAIAGVFRLRTRALQRRNTQLEALVAARTSELSAQNLELARLNRLELDEKISARLAEEKARLEVLRYQLNPHFLFNSLNSIYTLVWSHSRPAGDLVRRLAEFCRMTLTRGPSETATLAEEFTMLRAYLDLESSRWQEQLQVEITLAPAAESLRLPPFLLLPLVENAIKYGGHTSPDLLRIRVTAHLEADGSTVIEVANSGTWVEPGTAPEVSSTNIGLENLRERLARHFPARHTFTTTAQDGWVVARLTLSSSS